MRKATVGIHRWDAAHTLVESRKPDLPTTAPDAALQLKILAGRPRLQGSGN